MAGPPVGLLPLEGVARAVLQRPASAKKDWWVSDQTCCVLWVDGGGFTLVSCIMERLLGVKKEREFDC